MTRSRDDIVSPIVHSHHSVNPFHSLTDVTNSGVKSRPAYAPQRAPFTPYREPRTQEPSFHNPIYAALPLTHLIAMRTVSRLPENMDQQSATAHGHNWSLLRPIPVTRAAHKPAFAQDLPRMAFTPKSARNNR